MYGPAPQQGPGGRGFPWGTKPRAHGRVINPAPISFSEISFEASLQKPWIQSPELGHQTDLAPRALRR